MKLRWIDPRHAPPPPHPTAMQQHPRYGAACLAWGRDARWAEIGGIGTALAVMRRVGPIGAALVSRGPVWAAGADADALRALRPRRPGVLLLTAEGGGEASALSAAGMVQVQTPLYAAHLDLSPPEPARRAAQSAKWRNRLVAAEGAGLKIRRSALPADPSHWLLRDEAFQQRARGYRGLPPAFAAAWASTGKGAAQMFIAHRGGDPLAAMLILMHAPAATYHIGWSGAEGRALNAHNLILWRATKWLVEQGVTRLDLGGVNTEDAPGLARFKIGAGAQVQALGGAWLGAPGTAALARIAGRITSAGQPLSSTAPESPCPPRPQPY